MTSKLLFQERRFYKPAFLSQITTSAILWFFPKILDLIWRTTTGSEKNLQSIYFLWKWLFRNSLLYLDLWHKVPVLLSHLNIQKVFTEGANLFELHACFCYVFILRYRHNSDQNIFMKVLRVEKKTENMLKICGKAENLWKTLKYKKNAKISQKTFIIVK